MLTSASGGVSFAYDPLLRLYSTSSGYRFAYDGLDLVAEYNNGGALIARHVFGPGVDEPVVSYIGSGTDRRFLAADERGTIVLMTDNAGTAWQVNQFDEFGKPGAFNSGRFQYTGQVWLPEIGVQYSKARMYAPHLGRFLQTDPIGYWDGPNLYAYVLNDPVNWVDPLGLEACGAEGQPECPPIVVIGRLPPLMGGSLGGAASGNPSFNIGGGGGADIVVTAKRKRHITICESTFAGALLSNEGLSFDLGAVEFRSGLNSSANAFTRAAYAYPDTRAVTQFNTIYVKPKWWGDVTNPRGSIFWEEIAHTAQFSTMGYRFYAAYGEGALYSKTRGKGWYSGNPIETQAQRWAEDLSKAYRMNPCAR